MTKISSKILIEAESIAYSVQDKTILRDISFSLESNQITTIIGPNGAGKSTLVSIVIGLNTEFTGRLTRTSSGQKIGYLPQKVFINPLMPITVSRLLNLTQKVSRKEIIDALTQCQVDYLLDQQVHSLSGGELQRVLLARTLLGKPDLIVLDEPTAGVDVSGELKMYDLIGEIRDRLGCAVLLVSHDLHLVMSKTDQVLCLNQHLCCSGKPESVSRHPEYLSLFGQQAADSIAVYTHTHDHEHDLSGDCHEPHQETHEAKNEGHH